MSFSIMSHSDGLARLSIEGSLDALTSSVLRPELTILLKGAPARIELDLSQLRSLDSAGAGLLLSFIKRVLGSAIELVLFGSDDNSAMFLDLARTLRPGAETNTSVTEPH